MRLFTTDVPEVKQEDFIQTIFNLWVCDVRVRHGASLLRWCYFVVPSKDESICG